MIECLAKASPDDRGSTASRAGIPRSLQRPAPHGALLAIACCLLFACGNDALQGGAGGDVNGQGGGNTDTKSDVQTAGSAGFGKACAGNADCASFGLTCYPSGASGNLCSRGCKSDADCGGGTVCSAVQGSLICTLPGWCAACKTDADCGPEAPVCRTDRDQKGNDLASYCTPECVVGDKSCPPGASCSKGATTVSIKAFSCRPDIGTCSGDGSQCSPCRTDADCSPEHGCIQPSAESERFCAQRCESSTCKVGYLCAKLGGLAYCYADIGGKAIPTCSAGKKQYCDICTANWQCASNRCVSKNDESFCAQPGTCSKASELTDCPPGTACVPTSDGLACTPPLQTRCHLWKACSNHPCGANQACVDGLCLDNP